jgi:hypothetical protein
MKQETIEEASEKYANMHQDVSGKLGKYLVKAVFQDGAKCQSKRMYSEVELFINEVKDKIDSFEYSVNQNSYISEYLDEWFEQFKKKYDDI